jgi:hypothetical protein
VLHRRQQQALAAARATGHGGRLTIRGHFVLDKRTGEVPRNTVISTCRVD